MKANLTKKERLSRKSDLARVFSEAQNAECRGLKLLYLRNGLKWNRVVFCPVRQFNKAVHRNREKRIFREVYRSFKQKLEEGYDFAFIIYPGKYSFSDRMKQVNALLEQVDLKK
jgi:ribonuclease P protein component